ncbi:multidrug export protein MepA [Clostridium homopropionicum DSM 5847]|uniref:Multidrug export protein MepA n=1 Tax=Clostridium homopropionicum DSM 5847 TaxID=1121318 RepID=A0A0L6ZEX6_9CLOT|nr:MATE family efflux transporter [Clostridium homopropionicum]KOA21507.1 multidrug export protein MepA [Clostridium homopropionicum DSM 5847]SFG07426.1 putative efflux protein, MATE family [Clostridium homopropionicum]
MDKSKQLETGSISSLLLKFSVPAIIGMLVNAFYNLVDRIYIGNMGQGIGEKALAGLGITMPIMTTIMAFGMLVGIGSSTIVSLKLGEKNKDKAEEILGLAVLLNFTISILISIIGLLFITPILKIFGADADSIFYAKQYIIVILSCTVFQNMGFGINNIIRSEGNPKIAMRTMLVGAFLNIILDPIFIFDFGLGLGIKGAAIATVISQIINTLLVLHYFTSKNSGSILKLKKSNLKFNYNLMLDIFSIGLSPFTMQLAASCVSILYNKGLLKYGGNSAVAAMSIIVSISMIIFMPIFGINQGVQPILGYNYGAKQYARVKKALRLAILSGIFIASLGFIAIEFFPKLIFKVFAKDAPELIELGSRGIRIDLMFLPIIGYQVIASNYFQAIGKAKISLFLSFLRQVIVLIPIILILPNFLGLTGLWLSQPIADVVAAILTSFFLYKGMKELKQLEKLELSKIQTNGIISK